MPPSRNPIMPFGPLARRWRCSEGWPSCPYPTSDRAFGSGSTPGPLSLATSAQRRSGTSPPSAIRRTSPRDGSVVISASAYDQIREHAIVRALGTPELKGKSQAVEVYELLGLREAADSG